MKKLIVEAGEPNTEPRSLKDSRPIFRGGLAADSLFPGSPMAG